MLGSTRRLNIDPEQLKDHHMAQTETDQAASIRQRMTDAFAEGTDNEKLRRARIDAQFKPSPEMEEMAAAVERDPSHAERVLSANNRLALAGYFTAKERAEAAQALIDRAHSANTPRG